MKLESNHAVAPHDPVIFSVEGAIDIRSEGGGRFVVALRSDDANFDVSLLLPWLSLFFRLAVEVPQDYCSSMTDLRRYFAEPSIRLTDRP